MSGGSFNYLYAKDPIEILTEYGLLSELKRAKLCLSSDYDSPKRKEYVKRLDKIILYFETIDNILQCIDSELTKDLTDILHAIEWHQSADYGKEDVEAVLNE